MQNIKRLPSAMLICGLYVMLMAGKATAYTEAWGTTAAGWVDRDTNEMLVVHHATVGNPAGSLEGQFSVQDVPTPETDAFRATEAASDGVYAGDYWTAGQGVFSGWQFDFYAADTMPSDLLVRFGGAGHEFFANAMPPGGSTGVWYSVQTPTTYGSGWVGGTEAEWSNALSSVEFVEVQVTRNGAGAQAYYIDNFSNQVDQAASPALVFSKENVNVREGGEGRFFVKLNRMPASNTTVTIARSAGNTNLAVKSGAVRSFKSSNWDVWQAVVLAAGADVNADNETATFRMSAPGYEDTLVTATALDEDLGDNLALPASGSTLAGMRAYQLAQVVDGVHTASVNYGYTIWTNDPPGTMTLDLQRATTLSRVRLLNWDWVCRVNRYRLEASADGTTWTDLATDAHETDRQGWDDWPVAGDPVRYVRFTGLSSSANQCVVISELEVYGTPEPLPALAVSKTAVNVREQGEGRFFVRLAAAPAANVAVTVARSGGDTNLTVTGGAVRVFKPSNWDVWQAVVLSAAADANADSETATFQVSAPGYADTVVTATALDGELGENLARAAGTTVKGWRAMQVANVVDGVHTSSANYGYTIWTNVPPGMLTVDLKSLKNLVRVRLLTWDWTYRVNRYRLEASADGVIWTDLAPTAQTTDRQGWDDWPVTGEPVRYVRFTGLYSSANQCAALSELEIFGGAPARRSAPTQGIMTETSEPVSVLTSDGPEDETGWNAVDGDPETAWTGQKAGAGYLVIEYAPALTLRALDVDLAEGSLSNLNYLYSQDAEDWLPLPEGLETNPVSLNFLWLVFPGDETEAIPAVLEIRPNP